ncbi:MAG: hypothetical protein LBB53_05920 [Prevotellaceae bacterium]|jgi:hypothetical protein|nr:hypothetical protein [Prevotellaceae bacterium]
MRKFLPILTFLGVILFFFSCVKQLNFDNLDKNVEYGTSLVIPIGYSQSTIFDIFTQINESGTDLGDWVLGTDMEADYVYMLNTDILRLPIDDKIAMDLSSSSEFNFYEGTHLPQTVPGFFDFDLNDSIGGVCVQRVDLMHVKPNAKLTVDVELDNSITLSGGVNADIRFPNIAELAGEIFRVSINSAITHADFELPAFTVEFNRADNLTGVEITFSAINPAFPPQFNGGKIKTNVKVTEMNPDRVLGFFNRPDVVTGDYIYAEIPSDLFTSGTIQNNRLLFHNPIVEFSVENNLGVPLKFIVDSIRASDDNGRNVFGDFNGSRSTDVPIQRTYIEYDSAHTSIQFNRENGGTNRLFGEPNNQFVPKYFDYGFHVEVDHDAVNGGDREHFVTYPAFINMYINTKLPFHFDETTFYQYKDTIEADLGGSLKIDNIEINFDKISVDLKFEVSIPIKAVGTARFLNETDNEVYVENNIEIKCPAIYTDGNDKGKSKEARTSIINIQLDRNNYEKILSTKKIAFDYLVDANNPQTEQVNIRATDYLKTSVSLFVKGKLSTHLDSIFGGTSK